MATSMGPNFPGHPAGMGHPGAGGHPMGSGMPPNQGQQGNPGGMPQQFAGNPMGAGTPGGHLNPAMMGGMPPGGPNAHALQHLSPAQQQQLLQQQHLQNQFNNPNAMAAMRHQQQILQQQQRQSLMAQQAMGGGMQVGPNGMPMSMQLNQLSPQQLHQLRQAGRLPMQHPQAQALMAQQFALQQQQQQQGGHNPQMQGGPNQGQHMQMNHQAMQNMQGQNPMGANAQGQMAGQQQGPQPQGQGQGQQGQQQGQQGQQGQHGQQGQQGQQGPQGQQSQQQNQQGQQGNNQATTQAGSQAGTPAPTGQQTPQPAPTPGPNQQAQGPPGQQQPQQGTHMQMAQQINAAQQMAMTNNLLQQQHRERMKGQCLIKLLQFSEHLSGFPGAKAKDDLSYWNAFVASFFSPLGVFRHSLHLTESEDTTDKQYEIAFPAIARYFHTHFGSGVKSMQLVLDKGIIDRPIPGEGHIIENPKASFVYWFETGSHLVTSGTLRVQFDAEQRIDLFEFFATSQEEYIARKQVIDAAKPAHMWMKEWHKVNSTDGKTSPEMSKKGKGKQLKSPQTQPPEVLVDLPDSAVNSKGVTEAVNQFLELVEVMGQMNPLFGFTHSNPGLGPYAALEQYVSTYINGAPQGGNGQQGPQGPPRTPSFGQFPMGASPAAANMNLPGSPHIGSPAPGQMQAPAMQLQQSQQGTSSSGPSANTSPASNKRRRPSAVKAEDDGSAAGTPGSQVNGVQNRGKPATPRMPKRVKANPS